MHRIPSFRQWMNRQVRMARAVDELTAVTGCTRTEARSAISMAWAGSSRPIVEVAEELVYLAKKGMSDGSEQPGNMHR